MRCKKVKERTKARTTIELINSNNKEGFKKSKNVDGRVSRKKENTKRKEEKYKLEEVFVGNEIQIQIEVAR